MFHCVIYSLVKREGWAGCGHPSFRPKEGERRDVFLGEGGSRPDHTSLSGQRLVHPSCARRDASCCLKYWSPQRRSPSVSGQGPVLLSRLWLTFREPPVPTCAVGGPSAGRCPPGRPSRRCPPHPGLLMAAAQRSFCVVFTPHVVSGVWHRIVFLLSHPLF